MRWLAIGFSLFLVAVVILVDNGIGMPFFRLVYNLPGADKTGHFFLMGTLSFLVNMSLSARRFQIRKLHFLVGSTVVTVIVTLEEFSQLFISGRSFSYSDLLSDYAGILVFGRLASYLIGKKQGKVSS